MIVKFLSVEIGMAREVLCHFSAVLNPDFGDGGVPQLVGGPRFFDFPGFYCLLAGGSDSSSDYRGIESCRKPGGLGGGASLFTFNLRWL